MNEVTRLNTLRDLNILDTPDDENLDRVTRLAANTFRTKAALVSLVDENRQWFKSAFGSDVRETSRDVSFCAHAIEQSDVMVVLDTARDARFVDNELVTGDPNIAFYAGAQLRTKDGTALGTLCIIDDKPREAFDERERQILADLAETVMTEIEKSQQAETIDDLSLIAQELQHRMGNMYAQVGSLVSLMADSAEDKDGLVLALRDKIGSLSQAQSMISSNIQNSVPLSQLADGVIKPLIADIGGERVIIQKDDDLEISPRGAFMLSLLLNELSTNALKHGALKSPEGQVSVNWSVQDEGIELIWRETTNLAEPPAARSGGFGMMLLEKLAPAQMKGAASFAASAGALTYRLSAAADQLIYSLDQVADAGAQAIASAVNPVVVDKSA